LSNEGLILGNATLPTSEIAPNGQPYISHFVPVVVDLERGIMQPLRPFFDVQVPISRNLITAVQRGPFARVVNTGSCLNVRREPQLDGRVIDRFSEGVLLRDISHGLVYADEWVQVVVPGGEVGWANAQYLER
jgi:hypothetical protein